MDITSYLLNVLILGQCLFFMWLYEFGLTFENNPPEFHKLIEGIFYVLSCIFIIGIVGLRVSYGWYKTHLILQYVILVLYAFRRLNVKNSTMKAISLSFLLVFFNSYLWESVLHFAEYTINPIKIFNFRELIHLIVLPFLYAHYTVNKKPLLNSIRMVLFINFLFSMITVEVYPRIDVYNISVVFFNLMGFTHLINRIISLVLLIDMFNNHVKEKKERNRWF